MKNIVLYMDGYTADSSGDIGWLSVVEVPGGDYGYNHFYSCNE